MRGAARRASLAAAAVSLVVLGAAPALAGATDPPTGVVDQATDAAHSAVDDATDAVSGVVGDVTDAASDATGGATDPVTDPVQDVVDQANDTAQDATSTVEETVDNAAEPVDDAIDAVDEATGGVIGDVTGPREGDEPGAGGNTPGSRGGRLSSRSVGSRGTLRAGRGDRRDGAAARRHHDPRAAATAPGHDVVGDVGEAGETAAASPSLGDRLGRAAIDASKQLALPLGLAIVVLGFVVAQHWADRKDPKLVLAPVESDFDLLTFQ